jgi:hypothetical protein
VTDPITQPPEGEQAPQSPEAPATAPTDESETWEKRMSGLQRAHNEETRVLREQLAAAQAANQQTTQQQSQAVAATAEDAQRWKAQAEENAKALQQERQQRIVDTRTARYPFAAESLGDPGVLMTMDEAKLAGLNERLAPPQKVGTRVDPNGAGRTVAPNEVPIGDKTTQQLKDDLVKYAPEWVRQMQDAQRGG